MTINELYLTADDRNIEIMTLDCKKCGSMSIKTEQGNYYIGMDRDIKSTAEKRVRLAHEIGHCATDSFYCRHTLLNNISKLEVKADKWAIQKMIPLGELIDAFKFDYVELWEIADYFGVTLEYAAKALKLYGFVSC